MQKRKRPDVRSSVLRLLTAVMITSTALILQSCFAGRLFVENATKAMFGSPGEVKNKVKEPVRDGVGLSALWVGHSTVLLQIEDKVILIDPVFNDVIGGLMVRKNEAALDLDVLPRLDLVLVSHAHMDHLSLATLGDINDNKKFAGTKVVFPAGVEDFLPDYPELDLVRMKTGNTRKKNYVGETKVLDGVKVTTVFTVHYGGRFGFDSYLWHVPGCTGFVIEYKGKTVFYPGDTNYDDEAFKAIGRKFSIDLALIPIGPCRDCMEIDNFNHVTSFGALKMFEDLKAEYMIPVHYGCIEYRNDPDEPLNVLRELITKDANGSSGSGSEYDDPLSRRIIILDEGQQHVFK
ncbi:MAG: MBL fold metallo-hydrolase [Ignavibacteria bacterium]|nr:MBL fold metallo-hydrolase [Ignavibacteria bacterium]